MKILGIDTSTKFLCIGIYNKGAFYEYRMEVSKKLSSLIALHLKMVLDAAGLNVADIDYFACGLGPGSFTGLRIGIATIKGLSFATGKPLVGVSTLDVLARNALPFKGLVAPIVDAKRGLIYASVYKGNGASAIRIKPYMLTPMDDFLKILKGNAVVFGDAAGLYKEKIQALSRKITILDNDYWFPSSRRLMECALMQVKEKRFLDAFRIKPIYLYPKECQIRKTSGTKNEKE